MENYILGDTIPVHFPSEVNGVPTALAGSPACAVREAGSATNITAGVSALSFPYTGANFLTINTATASLVDGKKYQLVMTAGTLDGVSVVDRVVYEFTLSLSNYVMKLDDVTMGGSNLNLTINELIAVTGLTINELDISTLNGTSALFALVNFARFYTALDGGVVNTTGHTPTTTEFQTNIAVDEDKTWLNQAIFWLTGANQGVTSIITGYTFVGGRARFTVTELENAPTVSDSFVKMGRKV